MGLTSLGIQFFRGMDFLDLCSLFCFGGVCSEIAYDCDKNGDRFFHMHDEEDLGCKMFKS